MSSKFSRRDALGLGGAGLALLAGCLTHSTGTDSATTGTETTPETTEPSDATETFDATVDDVSVTPELVAPNSPDSIATFGDRDEQFVVVRFRTGDAPAPDPSAGSLDAGDDTYAATEPDDLPYGSGLWDDDEGYVDVSDGYLVFSLPKPLDADEVTLRWPGGEHALSKDAVGRLARPPTEFAVREFSAPESVESGEEVTATLVVENVGDVDGTFVGALNRIGPQIAYMPVEAIALDVAAGESASWTHTSAPSLGSSGDSRSMTLRMDRRGGDESVSVMVERRSS